MEGGCPKIVLVIINTIFLIFGIATLALGIVLKVGFDKVKDALVSNADNLDFNLKYAGNVLSIGIIAFGCFIILVALLGCVGACCRIRCLLVVYAIIVIIILIAELGVVILALVKGDDAKNDLNKGLLDGLKGYHEYKNKTDQDRAFDALFSTLECCGVNNYTDFSSKRVKSMHWASNNTGEIIPITCCKGLDYENTESYNFKTFEKCLKNPTESNAYIKGCETTVVDFINKNKGIAIGVGVAIFLIEILVIVMAFLLCCRSGDDGYKV